MKCFLILTTIAAVALAAPIENNFVHAELPTIFQFFQKISKHHEPAAANSLSKLNEPDVLDWISNLFDPNQNQQPAEVLIPNRFVFEMIQNLKTSLKEIQSDVYKIIENHRV
jgi:hypothetical protein